MKEWNADIVWDSVNGYWVVICRHFGNHVSTSLRCSKEEALRIKKRWEE